MGLFLAASGIVQRGVDEVVSALGHYAARANGTFEFRDGTTDDEGIGVIASTNEMTTVLYPDGFAEWDDVSQFMSSHLRTTVFSFHIHDGDLWMFVAFDNGVETAWFNPIPDYWAALSIEDRAKWKGDPDTVARLVPGVAANSVERYFRPWTDDVIGASTKAYDGDEYAIGTDWQLIDFMRRLGFAYPLDDTGTPTGPTFYLRIRRRRIRPSASSDSKSQSHHSARPQAKQSKPWWKFW